jgi:adenylate kinase
MIILIAGSPGVGKKTVGKILSNYLRFPLVDLNHEAISHGLGSFNKDGDFVVNTKGLSRHIQSLLNTLGNGIIVGHLVADVVLSRKIDMVIVLRASPQVLAKRYGERGYDIHKVKENVAAEILDVPLALCVERFGSSRVKQIDTTKKSAKAVARQILAIIRGKKTRFTTVNWLKNADPRFLDEYFEPKAIAK